MGAGAEMIKLPPVQQFARAGRPERSRIDCEFAAGTNACLADQRQVAPEFREPIGSEIGKSEFRFRAIPNRRFRPPERALNPGVQVVCNQLTT